jgi:predicted O-methyltransferase YrrM
VPVLDDRVRTVIARLEAESARERVDDSIPFELRSRAVKPATGRFLFSIVAPQTDCEVLEIGSSRGLSTIWLAAAARILGGRVVTLEQDPRKIEAWRANVAEAGLEEWAQLIEGDARTTLLELDDVFDVVFVDAEKDDYETYFRLVRAKVETGALVIADNVLSHAETLRAYAEARQSDPDLVSVTVPLDSGLELTSVLRSIR